MRRTVPTQGSQNRWPSKGTVRSQLGVAQLRGIGTIQLAEPALREADQFARRVGGYVRSLSRDGEVDDVPEVADPTPGFAVLVAANLPLN